MLEEVHPSCVPVNGGFGERTAEAELLAHPHGAVRRALARVGGVDHDGARPQARASELRRAQQGLLRTRRQLACRRRGSLVASLALREAWSNCVPRARPPAGKERTQEVVAKC